MNKFFVSLTLCGLLVSPAFAAPVRLKGAKADAFIAKYFPNADIPGPVEGSFTYKKGARTAVGHASCNVPAMGARSEGEVSTCTVKY
ncbi:hypothetical protein [Methylocystis bryophila]|uniref:Uncharacterized protein n=1 Tax=Methylocystis bryophila TaxID=655015 RepID=A0A1W6MZP4_9HYPH|nr:hypothetical protein [Methylocystis bryophila]ARN83045.1 hypothetical protein B1812_20345 [Methylocystis bryophila]BDV39348.1 hypothetical protein DSM21852_26010 [Methylocystis bryophila]